MRNYLEDALTQPVSDRQEEEQAAAALNQGGAALPPREKDQRRRGRDRVRQSLAQTAFRAEGRPVYRAVRWAESLEQRAALNREAVAVGAVGLSGMAESAVGGARPAGGRGPVWAVLERLQRTRWGAEFARSQRRRLQVTVPEPETASAGGGLDAESLDRAVERDARRYDGGFALL